MDGFISTMHFTPAQSLIDVGLAQFHQVAPASHAKPQPPAFALGDVPHDLLAHCWGPGFEWVHPQGVLEIEADLHWPYFLTRNGEPLDFAWSNMHGGHLGRMWEPKPDTAPQAAHRLVLITGQGHTIFGHWLVDFLPKLWLLDAAGFDLAALRYVLSDDVRAWGLELLRLCGIGADQIVTIRREDVLRGSFLIPTTVHNGVRGPGFARTAEYLCRRIGIEPQERRVKLFLSRPLGGSRAISNWHAMEKAAYSAGYSVIQPERLSLLEQFRLMASARAVAGEYGSALHLSLFAGPDVPVCAVRGVLEHPGFIQSAIGAALRQPTGYVFCARGDDDVPEGFTVPLDAMRAALRHHCTR